MLRTLAACLSLCAAAGCMHAPPPSERAVDLTHDFGAETIYWPTEEGFVQERGTAGTSPGVVATRDPLLEPRSHSCDGTCIDASCEAASPG